MTRGPWDDRTPNTRWRMLCAGAWRPVLQMFDASNTPTTLPLRAVKAVLYVEQRDGGTGMAAVACGPADIMENPAHEIKHWDPTH
jgi:hypothetical protein